MQIHAINWSSGTHLIKLWYPWCQFRFDLRLAICDLDLYLLLQAITASGTRKSELFVADVNTQLKNKNITTDIKVDTDSNVSLFEHLLVICSFQLRSVLLCFWFMCHVQNYQSNFCDWHFIFVLLPLEGGLSEVQFAVLSDFWIPCKVFVFNTSENTFSLSNCFKITHS